MTILHYLCLCKGKEDFQAVCDRKQIKNKQLIKKVCCLFVCPDWAREENEKRELNQWEKKAAVKISSCKFIEMPTSPPGSFFFD